MSLANLSINVNVNAAGARSGFNDVAAAAAQGMGQSTAAVDDFRANLMRASDELHTAAQRMGSGMQAANDSIMESSTKAEEAVNEVQNTVNNVKFDSMSEKAAYAFGTGFAVAKTASEQAADWIMNKVKILAIAAITGIAVATIALGVAAYKATSFIAGLFTGDAYKSDNIDALIAMNNQVKDLQTNLQLSATDALALVDAMRRLGVNKTDYTTAFTNGAKAMRENTEELDRLGVKYKGMDGKLLETSTFLQNVKDKLDEYTVGYDRNAAAVAIGAGSYEQINAALKVNQNEIINSKERLEEYGLLIGPGTQEYVNQYEQAMRDFDNETNLTSQGFKRAIADSIMPALTDLANFFKDGWPGIVGIFRASVATIAAGFYMLKNGVYVITEAIITTASSIGSVLAGVGTAFVRILSGDFSGASQAFSQGLEEARNRVALGGANIVAQINSNNAAIKLAYGNTTGLNPNGGESPDATNEMRAKGKPWIPKQPAASAKPPAAATETKSAYATYIEELDRMVKKIDESEYASMRLKAQQLAEKEGITDLTKAYERINAVQRGSSQKVVDNYAKKISDETAAYEFQTSIMLKTKNEQDDLTAARQRHLEVENMIITAAQSGKPLDEKAIQDLRDKTDGTIELMNAQIKLRRELERTPQFGATKAVQEYMDTVTDAATQTKNAMTNAFKGMEDALVNFVTTGKLDFKSLTQSILSDMARVFIQQQIMKPLVNWFGTVAASMFANGGVMGSGGPQLQQQAYASGGVADSPQIAVFGEGSMNEAFVPLPDGKSIPVNLTGGGGGGNVIIHQPVTISAPNASPGTVAQIRAMMPAFLAENKRAIVGVVQQGMATRGGRLAA